MIAVFCTILKQLEISRGLFLSRLQTKHKRKLLRHRRNDILVRNRPARIHQRDKFALRSRQATPLAVLHLAGTLCLDDCGRVAHENLSCRLIHRIERRVISNPAFMDQRKRFDQIPPDIPTAGSTAGHRPISLGAESPDSRERRSVSGFCRFAKEQFMRNQIAFVGQFVFGQLSVAAGRFDDHRQLLKKAAFQSRRRLWLFFGRHQFVTELCPNSTKQFNICGAGTIESNLPFLLLRAVTANTMCGKERLNFVVN